MTISNEAVEAALDSYNATTPGVRIRNMNAMRAALEAAAPYMLPAPEGVSEAEKRMGELIQVIDSGAIPGISTPVLREDLNNILLALSSERERAEELKRERDEARAGMAYILDHAEYGDSYGVYGSDFTACHFCQGGGAPGVKMDHEPSCPVAKYPSEVNEWFAEMADAEARARAAEAKVKDSLRDLLAEAYLAGATDVHENYRPDPAPEFGEAAHDYAEAAALRWTETQGEGE